MFPCFFGRVWVTLAVLACLMLIVASSRAQTPPTNDLCSGAIVVPDAGPFPYASPLSDLAAASTNGDPALPSCSGSVSRSPWYKFPPAASALYAFSVGRDTATTVSDTVMAVYLAGGAGGCGSTLTEIACNDDASDFRSGLATSLTKNRTYYILVWMFGDSEPVERQTTVQLRLTKPVAPTNDICGAGPVIPA